MLGSEDLHHLRQNMLSSILFINLFYIPSKKEFYTPIKAVTQYWG